MRNLFRKKQHMKIPPGLWISSKISLVHWSGIKFNLVIRIFWLLYLNNTTSEDLRANILTFQFENLSKTFVQAIWHYSKVLTDTFFRKSCSIFDFIQEKRPPTKWFCGFAGLHLFSLSCMLHQLFSSLFLNSNWFLLSL